MNSWKAHEYRLQEIEKPAFGSILVCRKRFLHGTGTVGCNGFMKLWRGRLPVISNINWLD
ncbi:MAG: hypothetical protein R3E08_02600 [Thiotrichaceae bacterium]